MIVIGTTTAGSSHATDCRTNGDTSAPTANRAFPRRLATYLRKALRDRQPTVTISERALSDIHDVHAVHR